MIASKEADLEGLRNADATLDDFDSGTLPNSLRTEANTQINVSLQTFDTDILDTIYLVWESNLPRDLTSSKQPPCLKG